MFNYEEHIVICTECNIGLEREGDELRHHMRNHKIRLSNCQKEDLERELDILGCPMHLPTIIPSFSPRPAVEGLVEPSSALSCPFCATFGIRKTITNHIKQKHPKKAVLYRTSDGNPFEEVLVQRLQNGNQFKFFRVRRLPSPCDLPPPTAPQLHLQKGLELATRNLTEGLDNDLDEHLKTAELNPLVRRAVWVERRMGLDHAALRDLVDSQANRQRWPIVWEAVFEYCGNATERIEHLPTLIKQLVHTYDPSHE